MSNHGHFVWFFTQTLFWKNVSNSDLPSVDSRQNTELEIWSQFYYVH